MVDVRYGNYAHWIRVEDRARGDVFGSIAEQYDKARPQYPEALWNTLERSLAPSKRPRRAVDIAYEVAWTRVTLTSVVLLFFVA